MSFPLYCDGFDDRRHRWDRDRPWVCWGCGWADPERRRVEEAIAKRDAFLSAIAPLQRVKQDMLARSPIVPYVLRNGRVERLQLKEHLSPDQWALWQEADRLIAECARHLGVELTPPPEEPPCEPLPPS